MPARITVDIVSSKFKNIVVVVDESISIRYSSQSVIPQRAIMVGSGVGRIPKPEGVLDFFWIFVGLKKLTRSLDLHLSLHLSLCLSWEESMFPMK